MKNLNALAERASGKTGAEAGAARVDKFGSLPEKLAWMRAKQAKKPKPPRKPYTRKVKSQ